MKISLNGIRLIKQFEGLKLHSYQDVVGVWTVGYGTTGPEIGPGMIITPIEAENFLWDDVKKFDEAVSAAVKVSLTQNQHDACVCLAYNIGITAFKRSTLVKLLNAGLYSDASAQFLKWNKAGGKAVEGLTNRRKAERKLFLKPDTPNKTV